MDYIYHIPETLAAKLEGASAKSEGGKAADGEERVFFTNLINFSRPAVRMPTVAGRRQ